MVKRWFFSSKGQTYGPLEPEDIKARAALGELSPQDLIWPEGGDPQDAIEAEQAIDFPALTKPAAAAVPDWLDEVPADAPGPKAPAASSTPPASVPEGLPDWLEDVRQQQPPARPPVPEEEPAAAPEDSSVEISLDESAGEPAPEASEDLTLEAAAAAELAEQTQQKTEPSAAMVGMEETWRKVRVALERWIDLDVNCGLILSGDSAAIHSDVAVRQIIYPLNKFGKKMVDRMFQHLDFLADNRRKYYRAVAKGKG